MLGEEFFISLTRSARIPPMDPGLDTPYGAFRAPRLPLDLRCIAMGALGWGILQIADSGLAKAFGADHSPIAQVMELLRMQIGRVSFLGEAFGLSVGALWGTAAYALEPWQAALTALIFIAVWAVFGGALLRIAALRLTRNEVLGPREALRFGFANAGTLLAVPILVGLFVGVLAGLNAAAGFVMSLPLIGSSLLALVLFPLVLMSSLLIVMALIGGVLGLPLMWCGVTVERNGALEAVSRAFSYVSARPFHFFFGYLLIFVLLSVIMLLEGFFEDTTKATLKAGIVRTSLDNAVSKSPTVDDELEPAVRDSDLVRREVQGIARLRNIRSDDLGWYDKPGFFWMYLCLGVFILGIKGYAVYILLGGTMSLYLMLRRDVDGTHEDELPVADDEEVAPGEQPRGVGKDDKQSAAGADNSATKTDESAANSDDSSAGGPETDAQ